MGWGERKGSFLNSVIWGHGVSTVFALDGGSSGAFPQASGKADVWLQIPPCLSALHFVQRRVVTLFICLHIGFLHKSLFEAGPLWLSPVNSSVCQQAGSVHAPTNADPDNTPHKSQMERGADKQVSHFSEILPCFFLRPCLCLPYFHVQITPCVRYNEKSLIRLVLSL